MNFLGGRTETIFDEVDFLIHNNPGYIIIYVGTNHLKKKPNFLYHVNALSANPTEWSAGKLSLSLFDHFGGLAPKGLTQYLDHTPSWHLYVHSQHCKIQNNVKNMFKINDKGHQ